MKIKNIRISSTAHTDAKMIADSYRPLLREYDTTFMLYNNRRKEVLEV